MSDYPSTPSYAPGYGTRDQQNPPFLPPTYPNQYLQADDSQQGHMASHYDTSMSAYGYNRSIPSFSASAVAAGVPPLPIFTGWNQESVPLPSYTTPNNGTQYPGYTNSAQHSTPYYQTPSQPAYQQQVPGIKPYDQGDLDEGEFEENANATQTPSNGYGASQLRENGGTGYVDTAQRAVHSKARDYSPQQASYPTYNYNYSPRDSTQSRRQKSGSFSPYVPPVAAQTEHYTSYTNNSHAEDANSTPQSQHGWSQNGAGSSSRTDTQTNSYHQPQKNDAAAQQANPPPQPPSNQNTSMTNGRSVIESRKKAQAAILNLWPYDIRYQTYIDEGFSKEVVGSLFDELKMTRNSVKSVNEGSTLGGNSVGFSSIHKLGKENVPSGSSNTTSTGGLEGNNSGSNGLGKERASLSSLGNNTSSANSGGISTLHSAKAVAVPSKPAVMTEKQKTLQSKMEALRKSREERAQKAAAKVDNKASSAGVDVPIPQAAPTKVPLSHPSTSPSPLSTSPVPIAQLQVDKPSTSTSPAPPINVTQPASLIPGLFLASTSGSAPTSLPSNMSSSNLSNIRKRPVAADFDEATPISTPFKRPFGHSRSDQRLVITVSDDEGDSDDEDVAMDLESQATQDSPTQSARKMSDQRSAAIQNLPPLSNFPPRKLYTPPPNSSAANTPPIQGAPNTAGRLTHVQSEMEKLKKQIALREARQRAKQASSGSRTPQVSEANESRTNVSNPPATSIASKVESSIKMQEMIETAAANVVLDQQRLAEAQAAEVQKAAELKKSEDEQKRLRREELAADIPRVDAEVQQNQSRLELLRAEMAKIEASVQKSLEDKRLLAEEMERLGQEAEDQLQVQKDKLEDLNRQESTISEDPARPPSYGLVTEASDAASLDHSSIPTTATTAQPPREDVAGSVQPSAINSDLPRMELPRSPQVNGNEVTSGNPNPVSSPAENHSSETLAETKDQEVSKENSSTDQALEAALQEAVRAEVDSHGKVEDDMDIEDFYAPDPSQLTPQTPGHVREQIRSPEYSPTLDRTVPDAPQHESDDYEPPEATPPIDAQFAPDSPPFSPAPPEIVSEVADDENLNVDMPEFEPAPAANDVEQVHSEENLPSTNGSFPPQVVEERTVAVDKPETFTPYESPLKKFRAYRFHPNFKQDVSGGLKSKTYSHKIDVMNEFCRFELAGGICNDPTCDSQHFRDIGLPDDAVLTALGSPEEFKGEQRDRFCAGLRRVLLDLRLRKIRDFDVIASEIIAHRANFLGDKSKVLAALEGTTI